MNRHPNAVMSPPKTAVKRVDFLLQIPIVIGEINNERQVEVAPNQPGNKLINNELFRYQEIYFERTSREKKYIKLGNENCIKNAMKSLFLSSFATELFHS